MNTETIFIIIILLLGFSFLFFTIKSFLKKLEEKTTEKKDDGAVILLQNQISKLIETNQNLKSELTENINQKLSDNQKNMSESVRIQFQESQKLIKNITEELGEVKKTSGEVVSFTAQLKNLQDILQNSKQRGALGEYFLETTIKNILPPDSYAFQYQYKNKTIVDAIIKLEDQIIPIDSKFSLENYNKIVSENDPEKKAGYEKIFKEDLKKRVQETAKYISKSEKTMDFAFMFIPSEGIYYDLLVSKVGVVNSANFLEYAFRDKKVIVVSPSTLYAYLQTVMQGLKALKIEKKATDIIKNVGDLQKHMEKYGAQHEKLGSSLSAVVNHYNSSSKSLKQISNDSLKITGSGNLIEENLIEKPYPEE